MATKMGVDVRLHVLHAHTISSIYNFATPLFASENRKKTKCKRNSEIRTFSFGVHNIVFVAIQMSSE